MLYETSATTCTPPPQEWLHAVRRRQYGKESILAKIIFATRPFFLVMLYFDDLDRLIRFGGFWAVSGLLGTFLTFWPGGFQSLGVTFLAGEEQKWQPV